MSKASEKEEMKLLQQYSSTTDPAKREAIATRIVKLQNEGKKKGPSGLELSLASRNDSIPRKMLSAAAAGGRAVDEVLGLPVDAAFKVAQQTPHMRAIKYANDKGLFDSLKETAAGVASNVGEKTGITSWLENNPETAAMGGEALQATSLIPAASLLKKGINPLKSLVSGVTKPAIYNTETTLDGFYTGNPIGALFSGWNPKQSVRSQLTPSGRAQMRDVGTGQHRVDEMVRNLEGNKLGHAVGDARAADNMALQYNRGKDSNSLIEALPIARGTTAGFTRANDVQGLTNLMFPKDSDAPDWVKNRLVNQQMSRLGSRQGTEGKLARMAQVGGGVPDPDRAIVRVLDNDIPYSELGIEVAGVKNTGSVGAKAVKSAPALKAAGTTYGADYNDWNPSQWEDFYRTAAAFERDSWMGKEELLANLPDNPLLKRITLMFNKSGRSGVKSNTLGATSTQSAAMQQYFQAKARVAKAAAAGKDPKKADVEYVQFVDDRKQETGRAVNLQKDAQGNVVGLTYRSSYLSADQDLGGVGVDLAHDFKNNDIYAGGIDGHDLMGVDPTGGDQLFTVSQIDVGKPGVKKEARRKTADNSPEYAASVAAQVKKLEERSNIPRNPKETLTAYQARVLREYKAPAMLEDYMDLGNIFVNAVDVETKQEQ